MSQELDEFAHGLSPDLRVIVVKRLDDATQNVAELSVPGDSVALPDHRVHLLRARHLFLDALTKDTHLKMGRKGDTYLSQLQKIHPKKV